VPGCRGGEYLEFVDEGRTVPPRIWVDIMTQGMCGRNILQLKEKHHYNKIKQIQHKIKFQNRVS